MSKPSDKELIAECSQIIYDGFIRYNQAFYRITRRARTRFEQRDWQGHQQDIVARVDLYEKSVRRIVLSLRRTMDDRINEQEIWSEILHYFGARLGKVPDSDFIKTFFNSVTRRIFGIIGIDTSLEFMSSGPSSDSELIYSLSIRRYPYWDSIEKIFQTILNDFSFRVPYDDLAGNAVRVEKDVLEYVSKNYGQNVDYLRFEFIESFFYQAARAYLVGRMILSEGIAPLIIAFKNEDDGISIDAVLMSEREVSIVFGYTRSYYFADPNSVIGTVHFLHSILPDKPIDELYTVLGRLRQGKTERHRIFSKHLESTTDKFVHTEGDIGLVMIVFTLPSYDLVFKVIRDKFGYPKNITRKEVIDKYKLVSKHDRAGRLIDTQEFLNLKFPINRFSDELLEELFTEAENSIIREDDNILIRHAYVERRVRPLNIYINEVSRENARLAILDYGQALKDLAKTNIFPGDLLLKNFGVTHHNRIVFYDYDEVALVTECNFRDIPDTDDTLNEMRDDLWYYVAENDIFPEEFIKFLSMDRELRSLFILFHGDILTADYWRNIQQQHRTGDISLVVPYHRPVLPSDSIPQEQN